MFFFFLMIRRPPRSTQSRSSAASDVYKRQFQARALGHYANPPSRRLPEGEPHSTIGLQCRVTNRPRLSSRVGGDPSRGGTSPNSPRAGRQQGQVSSSRYAGGPACAEPLGAGCAETTVLTSWRSGFGGLGATSGGLAGVSGEPTRLGP